MPTYNFACKCGSQKSVFFKELPSEAKQQHARCDDCDGSMDRDFSSEGFFANGGTNFDVQKSAAFAMRKVDTGGQEVPHFRDENGKVHEVKNSGDIELWKKSNQLGAPRMVKWVNPKTGKSSMVPQRTIMKADPESGEPLDVGTVVRGSERLVELSKHDKASPPSTDAFGRPFKNGAKVKGDVKMPYIDPSTGKQITMNGLWRKGAGGAYGNGANKAREFLG